MTRHAHALHRICLTLMAALVPLVLVFYPALPDRVPLFVGLDGTVLDSAPRTLLTALRLPLMALILQIVIRLASTGLPGTPTRAWSGLALANAAKMLAEVLAIFFITGGSVTGTGQALRLLGAIAAAGGVLLALTELPALLRMPLRELVPAPARLTALLLLLFLYVLLALAVPMAV